MANNSSLVGFDDYLKIFNKALNSTIKGQGSILAVSGEGGMGKSTLLRKFNEICDEQQQVRCVLVENQAPVGSIKIGQIQPLLPFSKAIELILKRDSTKAEKKFAVNAGMTLLASIPFAGDVFYAVKELSRDWRQYKHDKKDESLDEVSSLTMECFQTLLQLATKGPLVILLDDMHWCDAQSVELLTHFTESISENPILLVFSYRNSIIEGKGTPLYSFMKQAEDNPGICDKITLTNLNLMQSREMLLDVFPDLPNNSFDRWIYGKSLGVPGVISEYLKYFEKYPEKLFSFNPANTAANEKFLPTSLNAAFSQILEELSEEEKNIIAVCSSEGREFSASVVSNLLNIDVLSTIKKLRHLQQKTGIIRSLGAKNRYGMKTTVYEFTQAFYYNYFQSSLEFEEKTALHGQIASLLKQRYNDAENESIKAQIAPYLAAHSTESGDNETAKSMMLKAADSALEMGNAEIASSVVSSLKELNLLGQNEDAISPLSTIADLKDIVEEIKNGKTLSNTPENNSPLLEITDFASIRHVMIDNFNTENYAYAMEKAVIFQNSHYTEINSTEKLQFLAMMIRLYTELEEYEEAEQQANNAFKLISCINDPITESFVMNAYALLKYKRGQVEQAREILKEIAQNALSLPIEIKLVTLANIANILNETDPQAAIQYYNTVDELTSILQFDNIAKMIKS